MKVRTDLTEKTKQRIVKWFQDNHRKPDLLDMSACLDSVRQKVIYQDSSSNTYEIEACMSITSNPETFFFFENDFLYEEVSTEQSIDEFISVIKQAEIKFTIEYNDTYENGTTGNYEELWLATNTIDLGYCKLTYCRHYYCTPQLINRGYFFDNKGEFDPFEGSDFDKLQVTDDGEEIDVDTIKSLLMEHTNISVINDIGEVENEAELSADKTYLSVGHTSRSNCQVSLCSDDLSLIERCIVEKNQYGVYKCTIKNYSGEIIELEEFDDKDSLLSFIAHANISKIVFEKLKSEIDRIE